ncbi:MAG: GTPase HflX [Desulfobacterota bacterium]|nr:GTPase HflX [Thermodesulfobacteriota bacterium]
METEEAPIPKVFGNTVGLKPSQIRRIEHIYRRRIPPQRVVTLETARLLLDLSNEIRRQIGILVSRKGIVEMVMIGDHRGITIPDLSRYRIGIPRLRGLRLIHTHLQGEPLSEEDFTDLALLRLDMMVALSTDLRKGEERVHLAHLLPDNPEKKAFEVPPPSPLRQLDLDFLKWIQSLEDQFQKGQRAFSTRETKDKAILVSVSRARREAIEQSLEELKALAESSGLQVIDAIIQRPQTFSTSTLMGEGKLRELVLKCMQTGVDLIIFDQNLTPGQMVTISDLTELRVIDRTQLILDIFAQRAKTREGKTQVELAQLKYLLPRLGRKTLALSRLTGGIGGRGPGETKLEIDRRRARDRIHLLEKELEALSRQRAQRRALRRRSGVPIFSIVGYTNVGKSTLFNLLTESQFDMEDKLFATLDTATRRIRRKKAVLFEDGETEVVITDTVGFIKDLPKDLMGAFRPTFDELRESDLLIHLADISSPRLEEQIEAVERILEDLGLGGIPRLLVLNKEDKLDPEEVKALCRRYDAVSISALKPESLEPFYRALSNKLREIRSSWWSDPLAKPTSSCSWEDEGGVPAPPFSDRWPLVDKADGV